MSAFWSWRWSALAVAFGLMAPVLRAEMITPNSIPNPPTAVASTPGTPVYASNGVSTQYTGLGLNFSPDAAITKLNGISVWTPIGIAVGTAPNAINYALSIEGNIVSPGSSNPTSVSSLTLNTFGLVGTPTLQVNGLNGQLLNIVPVQDPTPAHLPAGSQMWTFTGPGISSFSITPSSSQTGAWGVSGISFTTPGAGTTTPEPSSLVLAGLGALGMVGRFGWRRRRAVVA